MIDFYKNCKSFSIYNVNTSKALSVSSRKRIVINSAFGYFRDGKYHVSNEINFIFDTGAVDVTFPAYLLGIENEQELFSKFDSVKAVYRSGINKAAPVKYYKVYADVYIYQIAGISYEKYLYMCHLILTAQWHSLECQY